MRINEKAMLKGLLSTLETVNQNLECTGDCEGCLCEYEENECLSSEIATLKNRIAEMGGTTD